MCSSSITDTWIVPDKLPASIVRRPARRGVVGARGRRAVRRRVVDGQRAARGARQRNAEDQHRIAALLDLDVRDRDPDRPEDRSRGRVTLADTELWALVEQPAKAIRDILDRQNRTAERELPDQMGLFVSYYAIPD